MGRYLIRRFAELILTVFLIATATFFRWRRFQEIR